MAMATVDNVIIGIDEAGRGPLAGPVSVSAFRFCVNKAREKQAIIDDIFGPRGIRDSKKMSPKDRERIFNKIKFLKKEKKVDFAVALQSVSVINNLGISIAIKKGVQIVLAKTSNSKKNRVLLDGSLFAPKEFINQITLIKGDEKVPEIALASVCAKVTRDRYMVKLSKKYHKYSFEVHKGYGTASHRKAILKFGMTKVHRTLFCRKLTK